MERRVAVVGAGAVGLSTAVQIQQLRPSANVTLIADRFTTETTSHGAAGIFRPAADKCPGVPLPQLKLVLQIFCLRKRSVPWAFCVQVCPSMNGSESVHPENHISKINFTEFWSLMYFGS